MPANWFCPFWARLFFLCVFAGFPAGAFAASLTGTVQDPQGRPIPNATLTLFPRSGESASSAATDSSGRYRFDSLAPGDYLLRAESPGFAAVLVSGVSVGNSAVSRDFSLKLAGVRDQVVVTASGTNQPLDEISKAVTVIDNSELSERDVFPLADSVALAPGVRIDQLGGPGSLTSIRIRGQREQDTAVLVDGLRMRDPSAPESDASGLIEDLLVSDADRVEVMNGAGSSLYGTNAIGGVVNLVTGEGGGRTRGSVLMEGGSLSEIRGRALLQGSFAKGLVDYSAGLSYLDVINGVDGDDPYRNASLQSRFTFHLSPSTRLTVRVLGGDAFGKVNSEPVALASSTGIINAVPGSTFLPDPDDPDSTRALRFLNAAVTLAGQPSAKFHYSVSFQTFDASRRYGDGPAGTGYQPVAGNRTLYDGRIQTFHAQADYNAGQHQLLSAGYEVENENYAYDYSDQSNPGAASAVNVTQRSHAVFVQDQARLLENRLYLTGGFRAQFFQLGDPGFLPSASAPYQGLSFSAPPAAYTGDGSGAYFFRKSGTKLRAHVGRGYRAPSLYERFGAGFDSVYGYSVYGDPLLKPEHSLSFDGGIDQNLMHGRLRASASYFYTRLQQVITFNTLPVTDPFGRFYGYENASGGLSRGVELSGSLSPARGLTATAAYTYVNAIEQTPIVGSVLRTFVIPRNQFSAAVTERIGTRTILTFDTLDDGAYLAPIFGTVASYVFRFSGVRRINAGFSYRLPLSESRALRFFARGENLLNQDYFESGFRLPGRIAHAGLQYEF